MKYLSFLILVVSFVSCSGQAGRPTVVSTDAFEKGIAAAGVQVLDVRTATEFQTGHIKNALQADWTNKDQFFDRIRFVDKDRPVYIYCLSGGRSAAAADWMRQHGFSQVVELQGGITAWKTAGKPLEGATPVSQMSVADYWAQIPSDRTVLVDFGATWCPPCVKMKPVVDSVVQAAGPSLKFVQIDAGVHTDVMKALQVDAIPVFIIYKNGKESWRRQGLVDRQTLEAELHR
ncbi:MAG TPA: thioredoxin domain-containing protein [Chitinophagaceae bacterium]|nr:thioredoxin domain-containing protein [Chitinophagaceae bacterium]